MAQVNSSTGSHRCGDAARTSRGSAGVDDSGTESGSKGPGESVRAILLTVSRMLLSSCCCCCCDIRITQHMASPNNTLAVMTDSSCSWPIIPEGHENEISAQSIHHQLTPPCEARQPNSKLCTLQSAVLLVTGIYDLHLASAPDEVRFVDCLPDCH